MDELTQVFALHNRVDLAREADFALGGLRIRPSRCEVEADGERRLLQRRVMQVLVALARSANEVVSQRELILRCWGGLSVTDDAIGRCIAQLRRLATAWPQPPFQIETIAGVGYRLEAAAAEPEPAPAAGFAAPARAKRWVLAAGVVLLVAAAGAVWALRGPGPADAPTVSIEPIAAIDGSPGSRSVANLIADHISGALNETGVEAAPPRMVFSFLRAPRSDLVFGGTVAQIGKLSKVRLYLEDLHSRATLWSSQFEGPSDQAAGLADQAAASATERISWALDARRQPGLKLTPHTLALFLRAEQALESPEPLNAGETTNDLEQVLMEAPRFAEARATYSLALVQEGSAQQGPGRERLLQLAASQAGQAIHDYPRGAGAAFEALYGLQRLRDPAGYGAAEAHLLEGLRQAPDYPFLNMRECQFLDEVGRAKAALPYCEHAIALRPMAPPIGWKYAVALYLDGKPQWADRQVEGAVRLFPSQEAGRLARFRLAAFGGAPQKALSLLEDDATTPHVITPDGLAALKLFLRAAISGAEADREAAVAAVVQAADQRALDLDMAVLALARLGQNEAALKLLSGAGPSYHWGGGFGFMVDPVLAGLRTDPRYWAAARRVGLVRYWSQGDAWPDFCDAGPPRVDCRALAVAH